MHDLFAQVLNQKDLSKAGDLFSLTDKEVEEDLDTVIKKIQDIANDRSYLNNDNHQSVVEICITRVTSAIRENGTIEKHAEALVSLLESCLQYNIKPLTRDEDPPHAKIASDILSCVFLNYSKQTMMELALPVAVKFLPQGNKELCRNMSSYLALAAIDNSKLLAVHTQPILDSILSGNKALCRVLPQIYQENKEPINNSVTKLVALLPDCDPAEKNSLLQLFGMIAKEKPRLLENHIGKLREYLSSTATSMTVLQTYVDMAKSNPDPFVIHMSHIKATAEDQPATLPLVAEIVGCVGKIDKKQAESSVSFLVSQLGIVDNHVFPLLLKEIKGIADVHPRVLNQHITDISGYQQSAPSAGILLIQDLKDIYAQSSSVPERKSAWSQTDNMVTVISLGNPTPSQAKSIAVLSTADNRSLHSLRNASTSTREINFPGSTSGHTLQLAAASSSHIASGKSPSVNSVAVNMSSSSQLTLPPSSSINTASVSKHVSSRPMDSHRPIGIAHPGPAININTQHHEERRPTPPSVTNTYKGQPHAIPFRDAVQQFCEKHLDKIKNYIDNVSARLPIPIKASIEENKSKSKKYCRLNFICFGRDNNCLYNQNFFTFRTKNSRIWIHIMFLSIQARSQKAVCQQDPSVGNLKVCWDGIKTDTGNSFVRLVTSSFPSAKDQDSLLHELTSVRYFDVFEFNAAETHWACFMCNHPEKATGLLHDGSPTIEGQLKEKKGRWKFLKRWKTRYFTLSGTTITYDKKDSRKETLPVNQIQSVKAVRKGMRDIPKAFEIFTNDQTYVFKAKNSENAEQWLHCIQIAVARSQKNSQTVSSADIKTWNFASTPQKPKRQIKPIPSYIPPQAQTKL